MFRKAFHVKVELELQAVTCPGVWLCPNGKVSLQLHLLGSCVQTSSLEPIFPLLYNEKFIFSKTYYSVRKLSSLQKVLGKESLYAELIQWKNCEVGNVLASFDTSLAEVLFPGKRAGTMTGIDVDLLMEPTKNFPGILSPKIEISTKTTIEDKIYSEVEACNSYVVNPNVFTSKTYENNAPLHQRKVCHTSKFHKANKNCVIPQNTNRPPFVFKKVDDNLILRKPYEVESIYDCKCRKSPTKSYNFQTTKSNYGEEDYTRKSINPSSYALRKELCGCNSTHSLDNCVICSKYKYYFESEAPSIKSKKCLGKRCCVRKDTNSCACLDYDENITVCNYPPKISLAEKIHTNLNDTLNRCLNSQYLEECSSRFADECNCSSIEDRCSSIGDFYKTLYNKTKVTCGKYISCK